tara:strand:+ start:8268 stop:9635 length:1368 start_codon:yes stop_codon:yes gene_type:complete
MYRSFLSRRYLRARRTNWIGMAGITVAVAALILILSIMSGFLDVSRGHLRGTLSDMVVMPQLDAPIASTGELPKRDADGVRQALEASPLVEAASPQYNWFGMLMMPGRERLASDPTWGDLSVVRILGVDPEAEMGVSEFRQFLENKPATFSGHRVQNPDDPFALPSGVEYDGRPFDGAVIGEQLANIWRIEVGEVIEIVSATFKDSVDQSALKVRVVGTFRSKNNEFDMGAIYLSRDAMKDWVGHGREFTQITVRLKDYETTKHQAKVELSRDLHEAGYLHDYDPMGPRGEVRLWEDFQVNMLKAIENEKTLLGIMLSLVLVVAAFTVFAILSMMVTEKRRDIGILSALGATPRGILGLFLMIGFWEAFVGGLFGGILGLLGAHYINAIERGLSSILGVQIFNQKVYLLDHIPTVIEPDGVALIVVGAFVASLIAAAFPAWRAARLDPVEALRHE